MFINIECESIEKTEPKDGRNIKCKVYMREEQTKNLFYELWENYGNEKLKEWIEAEGYKLTEAV